MKLNPYIVFRKNFDDTGMLFNSDDGTVVGLNATAVFIWERLAEGCGPGEVLAKLKEAADVPDSGDAEVMAFIDELKQKGYLSSGD